MFHCLCVLMWSLMRRGAYVVSPHGMLEPWILSRSRRLKKLVSVFYQSWFLRRASAFHILTDKEALDVAQGAPGARTVVIPNFTPVRAPLATRPPWWQPVFARRKVFLFFGRINDKKGWRELCTAWGQACSADAAFSEGAQLVFCGWLDGSPDFGARIDQLAALHGNVCFAGPQFNRHKQETLEAASVFILPSKSEGLPMVVLEAWAAGIPVLMTAACNLGVGFEYGAAQEIGADVDGISRGIAAAVRWSPDAIEHMALAGKRLVHERFSREIVGAEMARLYTSVAA
jgi:glycosyltransferase involved in cell wall biosynthesis